MSAHPELACPERSERVEGRVPGVLRGGALALLLLTLTACAPHGAEQLLLEQFFSASRLRDRTALQRISTVIFEPVEQGTVTSFTIADVTEMETPAGDVTSKQVTVSAPVRLPNGETATRKIILVLQRRDQWIVTGFTVARS